MRTVICRVACRVCTATDCSYRFEFNILDNWMSIISCSYNVTGTFISKPFFWNIEQALIPAKVEKDNQKTYFHTRAKFCPVFCLTTLYCSRPVGQLLTSYLDAKCIRITWRTVLEIKPLKRNHHWFTIWIVEQGLTIV